GSIARQGNRAASRAGREPGRLVRQSLIEGMLLTLLGAGAGLFAGRTGLRTLLALTPEPLSRLGASRIEATVLVFTLGISIFWGLLFSLAPTLELFKVDPGRSLQSGHGHARRVTGARGYRTRTTLVIVQVALSMVLLVSAGLLVRAFGQILRVDPGFRTDRHLSFRVAVGGSRYPTTEAVLAGAAELRRRLAALPGVTGVGAISHLPYDDLPNWGLTYGLEPAAAKSSRAFATARTVTPGLFDALDVRLVEGRFFTDHDEKNGCVRSPASNLRRQDDGELRRRGSINPPFHDAARGPVRGYRAPPDLHRCLRRAGLRGDDPPPRIRRAAGARSGCRQDHS
ncbi:MAG: hypothetical protein ACRD15_15060, partial [Vicinamibacterales bacterium]